MNEFTSVICLQIQPFLFPAVGLPHLVDSGFIRLT